MIRNLIFAPLFVFLAAASAPAQDENAKPIAPPGPLVAPVPDYAQWVETLSYPEDHGKGTPPSPDMAKGQVRTISSTRTGDIFHEVIVNQGGQKTEQWDAGQMQYSKGWDSPTWGLAKGTASSLAIRYPNTDWITADSYLGTMMYSGKSCLVFALGAPAKVDLSSPDTQDLFDSLPQLAFIDAQTHLPVEIRMSGVYHLFQFGNAPTDRLTLPDDLTALLAQADRVHNIFNHPPPTAPPPPPRPPADSDQQ
jgi:hypothetical protein